MQIPELEHLKNILLQKHYTIYDKPYRLNIIGIRSNDMTPNVFNDLLYVFYKDNTNDWNLHFWSITTDPGLFWLKNPSNTGGTALLAPNQYVDVFALDYHRGKYLALCQRLGKVQVYRDVNRDDVYNLDPATLEWGFYGINIHRASSLKMLLRVDKYSAGCQVFQSPSDFNSFIDLCKKHKDLYGNKFTYSLVVEADLILL